MLHVSRELPRELAVGQGQLLIIEGSHDFPDKVKRINILEDGKLLLEAESSQPLSCIHTPQGKPCRFDAGFWAAAQIASPQSAEESRTYTAAIQFEKRAPVVSQLGEIRIRSNNATPIESPRSESHEPLVVICMATYEPDVQALEVQIESICRQTWKNWILIVNDDASSADKQAVIRDICARDERIRYFQNEHNKNFYANFECALQRVPHTADFVALSDQDDVWYPQKLSRLVAAMTEGIELAYSDMRIVDDTDKLLYDSYWTGRKNSYDDLGFLLLANTVTGAASLFRRSLLHDILPFPTRIGDSFHDHWIACAALAKGAIGYVDEPLYDYRQHGNSVIGHCGFDDAANSNQPRRHRLLSAFLNPRQTLHLIKHNWFSALAVFKYECRRLEVITETLRLRIHPNDSRKRKALGLFGPPLSSSWRLWREHIRVKRAGHTTNDAELRLAGAYLTKWLECLRIQWLMRH